MSRSRMNPRELVSKATPRPWRLSCLGSEGYALIPKLGGPGNRRFYCARFIDPGWEQMRANAEYTHYAVNNLDRFLAIEAAARALVAYVQAAQEDGWGPDATMLFPLKEALALPPVEEP